MTMKAIPFFCLLCATLLVGCDKTAQTASGTSGETPLPASPQATIASAPSSEPTATPITPTATPPASPATTATPTPTETPLSTPATTPSPSIETKTEPTPQAETPKAAAPLKSADMAFQGDGKALTLGDKDEKVVSTMGDGFSMSEAISCDYDGMDKIYTYSGVVFYTYPKDNAHVISEIMLTDNTYETGRGIHVGSTQNDVVAAYGTDYTEVGKTLVYTLGSAQLIFLVTNDAVQSISWS